MQIFTIYDNIAKAYQNPIYSLNQGAAVRIFSEAINDESTYLAKSPQDFILYYIGEYEEQSGCITSDIPRKIIHGNECIDESRKPNIDLEKKLDYILSILQEKKS